MFIPRKGKTLWGEQSNPCCFAYIQSSRSLSTLSSTYCWIRGSELHTLNRKPSKTLNPPWEGQASRTALSAPNYQKAPRFFVAKFVFSQPWDTGTLFKQGCETSEITSCNMPRSTFPAFWKNPVKVWPIALCTHGNAWANDRKNKFH